MLYTWRMSTKPNLPDEIWMGKKEYRARTDCKVNGWLFVAATTSAASDILFPHVVREWPIGLRIITVIIPFAAVMLWVRSLARWIRGMDELHRRITLAATLFAVSATFFLVMFWQRLESLGLLQAVFSSVNASKGRWDIGTVGHIFLLMTFSYFLSHRIFSRRYQ
jgi:hypothetical protein